MNYTGTIASIEQEQKVSKAGKNFTINWIVMEDGQRFNAGFKVPAGYSVGMEVSFSYSVKFGSNQIEAAGSGGGGTSAPIKSVAPSGGGGYAKSTFPVGKNDHARSIIRQNCMTQAREIVVASKNAKEDRDAMAKETIRLARAFEAYATGDLDSAAADAAGVDSILSD